MWDVLIAGGTVVDGTGRARQSLDVAVAGDHVVAVSDGLPAHAARTVIEASDKIVCPGFVDIHTHSDVSLLQWPGGDSKLLQGVTTEVIGNCGFSPFPVDPRRADMNAELMAGIGTGTVLPRWGDLAGYEAALVAQRPAINVAALVGHGALRLAAMGLANHPANEGELRLMERLLAASLEQGALGMSTGRTYVPSRYGDDNEIDRLAALLVAHDALYATHSIDGPGFESFESSLGTGRRTAVRLQHSHAALNNPERWGQADRVVQLFDEAVADGVDAAYDVYPYDASSTLLMSFLPEWVQSGGWSTMRDRLQDAGLHRRAVEEFSAGFFGGIGWQWDRIVISRCPRSPELVGRSIAEVAEEVRRADEEVALELCIENGPDLQVVMYYRMAADVSTFLRWNRAMLGSDGMALPAVLPDDYRPHPRSYGAHARLLARFVREQGLLTLERAVAMMTSMPAARLGLDDRGILRPGAAADLVVFDATNVEDGATFEDPCVLATGVTDVFVNGVHTVAKGRATGQRGGYLVRRPGS